MIEPQPLSGPDFLEAVAETALHNGATLDYHELRKRAKEWRDDIAAANTARDAADAVVRGIASNQFDPPARDPRITPMPGDRFFLPVEVLASDYQISGALRCHIASLPSAAPTRMQVLLESETTAWLRQAIRIVPARIAALPTESQLPQAA